MNLRKFISGVSAFAIAASAFAGLAVTANADVPQAEVDYIGSSTQAETFDEYTGTSDWSYSFAYPADETDSLNYGLGITDVVGANNDLAEGGLAYTANEDTTTSYDSFDELAAAYVYTSNKVQYTPQDIDEVNAHLHGASIARVVNQDGTISNTWSKDKSAVSNGDGTYTVTHENRTYNLPTYASGKALTFNFGTKTTGRTYTATYPLSTAATKGTLHFETDLYLDTTDVNADGIAIEFKNSSNQSEVKLSTDARYGTYKVIGAATEGANSSDIYAEWSAIGNFFRGGYAPIAVHVTTDIDITNHTVSFTKDYVNASTSKRTITTATRDCYVSEDIKSVVITATNHTKRVQYKWSLDNMKLYNTYDAPEYTIKTMPYAGLKIDGADAEAVGADGLYTYYVTDSEQHSFEVVKGGYTNGGAKTVTPVADGSLDLTGDLTINSGYSYYEDFTYVDDRFGFTNATVSNGVLNFPGENGANDTAELTENVSINGSLITLDVNLPTGSKIFTLSLMKDTSALASFYWNTTTPKVEVTLNPGGNKRTINDIAKGANHLYQIYVPSTSGSDSYRPTLYIDGVKATSELFTYFSAANTSINKINMTTSNTSVGASINSIKVESGYTNTEPTATVTVDGTATNYLIGTTFTLPAAAEGKVWSADGTTAVESTTITVPAGGATYTQIDDPSAVVTDPSAIATWVKDYTATSEDGIPYDSKSASVWAFEVDPGTTTITKIGLGLNDGSVVWDSHSLNVSGGAVTFAAVLNKIKTEVSKLALYTNNDADNGYTVTID